jgi:hypothetical protein
MSTPLAGTHRGFTDLLADVLHDTPAFPLSQAWIAMIDVQVNEAAYVDPYALVKWKLLRDRGAAIEVLRSLA